MLTMKSPLFWCASCGKMTDHNKESCQQPAPKQEHARPVLMGGREEVKVREPFRPFDYAGYWKAERERLNGGGAA